MFFKEVIVFLFVLSSAAEASVTLKNETWFCKESEFQIDLKETDINEVVWELSANKMVIAEVNIKESKKHHSFVRNVSQNSIVLKSCMNVTCRVTFNNKAFQNELWIYYTAKDNYPAEKTQENSAAICLPVLLSVVILVAVGFTLW